MHECVYATLRAKSYTWLMLLLCMIEYPTLSFNNNGKDRVQRFVSFKCEQLKVYASCLAVDECKKNTMCEAIGDVCMLLKRTKGGRGEKS